MGVQPPLVVLGRRSHVAFVSDVYPECADEACNKRQSEEADKNPVKVRRLTRLLYRHWDEWRENIRHHVFVADVAGGQARRRDARRFRFAAGAAGRRRDRVLARRPRDRVRVQPRRERPRSVDHEQRRVDGAGRPAATPKKLTPNPAADVQPVFSPDGTTLFVRAQRRAGFESDRWYLDAYDRATRREAHGVRIARPLGRRLRAVA